MSQDRNEQSRQQFAEQQRRRSFQKAAAEGRVAVLDRFNNRLDVGALVLYFPERFGVVFQVVDVTPVMDPRVPPGQLTMKLQAEIPITYPSGVPARDLLKVGSVGADGVATLKAPALSEATGPVTLEMLEARAQAAVDAVAQFKREQLEPETKLSAFDGASAPTVDAPAAEATEAPSQE